jgi:hypothetical protein
MAGSQPATFRCSSTDHPLGELVAVGASPGARAVVLHRAVPAGPGTSKRRNGVDDGERKRESQSNLAQHDHSPRVEARSGFCGPDRETGWLFPRSHSNGVRSAQVFVCSVRCAVHVSVSCPGALSAARDQIEVKRSLSVAQNARTQTEPMIQSKPGNKRRPARSSLQREFASDTRRK